MCRLVERETAVIYSILYRLGITAKYRGFFHISYAIELCMRQPERLMMVTKWLYPEVAKHYQTNWSCVERNIRTAANLAWTSIRAYLEELAAAPLTKKPSPSQFLAILVGYISSDNAA